eukprot:scaffold1709_cov151-Skeletonema_menzelii.AAC.20
MTSTTAHRHLLKSCLKYTSASLLTIFTASMTAATYYRPVPATLANNDTHTHTNSSDRRTAQTFCSPNSPPWNRDHVPLLLQWARGISIGVTTLAIRLVMNTYGRYEIREDECYEQFLEAAITARREQQSPSWSSQQQSQQRGLLTVSNHRSLFDDPGILSCLLPLPIAIQPHHQRWGICSQEYCFNDALPSFIKGYIGAGQVLPISRGSGINQQLLLDFGRHLANGEWCHVFPEGGVWQWKELGGRRVLPEGSVLGSASDFADDQTKNVATNNNNSNNNNSGSNNNKSPVIIPATTTHKSLPPSPIGKLKWGVGKLIAHAPITPRVIPFAHCGMERLLPQDSVSGKTYLRRDFVLSLLPSFLLGNTTTDRGDSDNGKGLRIQIQFGHEINFDDLIQEHEAKYGKLWKYRGKEPTAESNTNAPENWVSSKEERVLYSKIVKRIEMHLEVLTKEVCR